MKEDKNKDKKEIIIEYMRKFPFYKWASAHAGIDVTTLENWRKDDKEFSVRVEIARAEGIRYWGGKASPDLILKSADPKTFKDRVDLTTDGEKLEGLVIIKDK